MHRPPATVAALATSLTAALLALTACGTTGTGSEARPSGGAFPMTVKDCGRDVTLEQQPQRVLTLGAVASTLMWSAGAADRITARANEGGVSLGPADTALRDVPIISPNQELSREVIIGQRPDVVISYGLNLTGPEDLAEAGIQSIVNAGFCDGSGSGPNPDGDVDFDDVYADIALYGRIFGTEQAADRSVTQLRQRVAAVQQRFRDQPPSVRTGAALYVSGAGVRAYGKPNMTHAQLTTLGLTDVFGDVDARIADISIEELIKRDPQFVVIMAGGSAGTSGRVDVERALRSLPGIERVTAIREQRYLLLESPFLLGSPLAVDGLETMAQRLAGPA